MPTALLSFRPFSHQDSPFFAQLATDPRVVQHIGNGKPWMPKDIKSRAKAALVETPLTKEGSARWFVVENSGEPVGLLACTRRATGVEIGYWVSPEHWGRGIAGTIVDQAQSDIPVLFQSFNLIAHVSPDNEASARALTRRGFEREARDSGLDRYVWCAPARMESLYR